MSADRVRSNRAVSRDWQQWHGHYDRQDPSLLQRLEAVRQDLRQALARARDTDGVVNLTTICAGDGRDVLPVLAEVDGTAAVRATARRRTRPACTSTR